MHIFQPDRYLLRKQMGAMSEFVVGSTLDIGAGECNRYGDLFRGVDEYVTMDIEPGPNVSIVGSIEDIPADAESFDTVVCTQVLEHVPHPTRAVQEMHRVLKRGGHVVITVPQMNELHEEPRDFFRYTSFGLERLFEDAGFVVVKKIQRGGFFSTCAQMHIRYCIDRFHLYAHPWVGRIAGSIISVYGRCMIGLDSLDRSSSNRKHAIGWGYVFQKPQP
ncbi:MAG: methyltransferase domain-containing protein [Minisyncoccia bacterium]